jgi:hypothetical protein
MFGIKWREDEKVWCKMLSFFKPACFLFVVGYLVVHFKQKLFTN